GGTGLLDRSSGLDKGQHVGNGEYQSQGPGPYPCGGYRGGSSRNHRCLLQGTELESQLLSSPILTRNRSISIPFLILLFLLGGPIKGQHNNNIAAHLDAATQEISIKQHFTYVNQSNKALSTLYFNDWNHAYANKNTALAKRFAEEFNRGLHLAKDRERGHTWIKSIVADDYTGLDWERVGNRDIIAVDLQEVLGPGESIELFLTYTIKLPSAKFTSYGYTSGGAYNLKDWYLTPA